MFEDVYPDQVPMGVKIVGGVAKVTSVSPCSGALRRTHVHINDKDCYDKRIPITIRTV